MQGCESIKVESKGESQGTRMWSWRFLGVLVLVLLSCLVVSFVSSATTDGVAMEELRVGDSPGAELGVVQMEGAPAGVVWVVQMSDIHISRWVPARGKALRRSLGRALKWIKPAVVLVTGDLTGTVSA